MKMRIRTRFRSRVSKEGRTREGMRRRLRISKEKKNERARGRFRRKGRKENKKG